MITADYTDENICKALGLPSVSAGVAGSDVQFGLRLVLKPSFHPESVVSLLNDGPRTLLDVRVFAGQLYTSRSLAAHPAAQSEFSNISASELRHFATLFHQLLLAPEHSGGVRLVAVDGMRAGIVVTSDGKTTIVDQNVCYSALESACLELLDWCIERLSGELCRRVLTAQTAYVSQGREIEPWESPPTSRILLLGPDADRSLLRNELLRARPQPVTKEPCD